MSDFVFEPSPWVPFRDREVIEQVRNIKREDITKHSNPDYNIQVLKDVDIEQYFVAEMFSRIFLAREAGEKLVMILPNPVPAYRHVARLINLLRVDCKHIYGFAMDEYADQDGNIAPEDWKFGFTYAMMHNFYYAIDEDLRPPREQIKGLNNKNLADYGKMLADLGNADICYSGPGWTGHLAFIEPDAPEFAAPLGEWKQMGPRLVTLSPFTLAQNSMHGSFGMSGDLSAVPPKAATIGPAQVIAAKNRLQTIAITVDGTATSWQRLIGRLIMHGPVTPKLPESVCQTLPTRVIVSETNARDIEADWDKGY